MASSNLENIDEIEANIFSKLKKVSKKEEIIDNIKLTIEENTNENTNENKIIYLENEINSINKKIDIIIELLQNK